MSPRTAPPQVVLWRHGQTAWNAEGRWQGQRDVPLTGLGERQAHAAAEVLAARRPVRVVSSDLSRASATAGALALAADLPVASDRRLREIHGGSWQGLLRSEVAAGWPELLERWTAGEDVAFGGDGERRSEAGERVADVAEEVVASLGAGETAVLVGHGGSLGAAMTRLLGLPRGTSSVLTALRNARWSTLVRAELGAPTPWRLLEHNAGSWATDDAPVTTGAASGGARA
ncbi:histidine phosphatase family protein [Pseudokineococcus sp. 1T1Z-3]|uniref:histidine phosphatase family protein n=1 Tax=Pseudokineococcus sp. 1T1Z-3 TaxID=3132745 RepID=UPI0030A47050